MESLRFAAAHRDRLFEMGQAARRRAESWSWDDHAQLLVGQLERRGLKVPSKGLFNDKL